MKVWREVMGDIYFDIIQVNGLESVEIMSNKDIFRAIPSIKNIIDSVEFEHYVGKIKEDSLRGYQRHKYSVGIGIKRSHRFGPGRFYSEGSLLQIPRNRLSLRKFNSDNVVLMQDSEVDMEDWAWGVIKDLRVVCRSSSSKATYLSLYLGGYLK